MSNLSLFDLSQEFYVLHDLMQDEFNEETGELIDKSKEIEELYSEVKLSLEDKLDNSQRYLLTLKGEEDILSNEIERLNAKKKSLKNKQEKLKNLMLSALKAVSDGKIKTPLYSFSIRKSEAVEIRNIDLISRNYLRVKYEADKTKIKKALKDGSEIEGANLVKNESLTIR